MTTELVACVCGCGCDKEVTIYNVPGMCLKCYRLHRTINFMRVLVRK